MNVCLDETKPRVVLMARIATTLAPGIVELDSWESNSFL
jgi:hypothetical protein